MLKSKIFLISLLMLFMSACFEKCDNPTTSEPPEVKYVDVEVKYRRVYDNLDVCPAIHAGEPFYDEGVYLSGFPGRSVKMEKIGDDLFYVKIPKKRKKCLVNYPGDKYPGIDAYKIYVIDNVWFDISDQVSGCDNRAHDMWFNGYKAPRVKVHKRGNREYLLVRFDEDGVPHFE